jgi:hypothetical protein
MHPANTSLKENYGQADAIAQVNQTAVGATYFANLSFKLKINFC